MGRSGYSEDNDDPLELGRWRGQIASATRGKRGQRFFRELITALDALPEKKLIKNELEAQEGSVCALGALGKLKGVDVGALDTEDWDKLGETFDIAPQLAQETMWINDEAWTSGAEPVAAEERFRQVRAWAVRQLHLTDGELQP